MAAIGNPYSNVRNPAFDMMKGIGILLMMEVHIFQYGESVITSFHMPLFFILSGFFSHDVLCGKDLRELVRKAFNRLIIPYLFTMFLWIAWGTLQYLFKQDEVWLIKPLLTALWMGGDFVNSRWGLLGVGPLWFLPALFWTKLLFASIQLSLRRVRPLYAEILLILICVLVSYLSMFVHAKYEPLPFSLIQGCFGVVFYALGRWMKSKRVPKWFISLCIVCWPISACYGYTTMYFCYMKLFPIAVLGACGGTYALYQLCNSISGVVGRFRVVDFFSRLLMWCGVSSLAILCMHSLEVDSAFLWSVKCRLPFVLGEMGMKVLRFVTAVAMTFLVSSIPVIKRVFGLEQPVRHKL